MPARRGSHLPLEPVQCCLGDRLRGNAEMPVEVLVGSARAEARHPDEGPVGADDLVPALTDGCLHGHIGLRHADDLIAH